MSSPIKVTFSQLAATQDQVRSTVSNINTQLADLKSYLNPLVQTWSGAAADNYNAAQAQWDRAAEDLNQVLSAIGNALGSANEGYQQTEKSNASRW
ncbi:WXG100 family type VII secretion target [Frankineae bacterium MT45]|nr:WXG100 family type VII secretion target [Frankineae bacterium MT45]